MPGILQISRKGNEGSLKEQLPFNLPFKWVFHEHYKPKSCEEGLPYEVELVHRRQAVEYIYKLEEILCANRIKGQLISSTTIVTAAIYLHRFYYFHSFYSIEPKQLAITCIFVAAKANGPYLSLERASKAYWALNFPECSEIPPWKICDVKDIIRSLETTLLLTLGFDVNVDLPHPVILTALAELSMSNRKDIGKMVYLFATDIVCYTDWVLRYTKEEIAAACIYAITSWMNQKISIENWWRKLAPWLEEEKLIEMINQFYVSVAEKYKYKLRIRKHGFVFVRKLCRSDQMEIIPEGSKTVALIRHSNTSLSEISMLGASYASRSISSEIFSNSNTQHHEASPTSSSNSDHDLSGCPEFLPRSSLDGFGSPNVNLAKRPRLQLHDE